MTALPHPANVSQNVPIASAAYFFVFMTRLSSVCVPGCSHPDQARARSPYRLPGTNGCSAAEFQLILAISRPETCFPQVDICGFVWYIRALRVKGLAFRQPFALPEFQSDQLKEDAACRFSFAITMSIKPSRR